MKRLTNEQLNAIRERAKRSTPGPWLWEKLTDVEDEWDTEMPMLVTTEGSAIMDFGDCETYYPTEGTPPNPNDAEFISSAREDVPMLLAEIERLERQLSQANGLLSEAHDLLDDVHCYETETYEAISRYFNGGDGE
ncbi:hypothetical protein [Cytobacillus solani]|uniref:Uncharacterized protein n=1 Tax=Cytobacillus solani TaxID=1637975 RepID=A0A0Q3VGI4_9BACI|nr:hypothetical protein [Cytobacillus solani]KQL18807.1 hypothetical protein AN957_09635 [Cytobacillus solani]